MISHDRAQEFISARMDAPLTPAEHRELQGHLAACPRCHAFVGQADDLARGLHAMPRLAPSPAVSRAVMNAIAADTGGWGWLRHGLQALSSPGMAVASSLALVLALAGALIVALNSPGRGTIPGNGAAPEETIAAVAIAPLPTEAPTVAATEPALPEPTATRAAGRVIEPAAQNTPVKTPTPRPTATAVPIQPSTRETTAEPVIESPAIQPNDDVPVADPGDEAPALAMVGESSGDGTGSADLAQQAVDEEQAAENPVVEEPTGGENVVADEPASDGATESTGSSDVVQSDDGGRKGGRKGGGGEATTAEIPTVAAGPVDPADAINPLPAEAIAALEGKGAPGVVLPPAPMDPIPPQQSFLPVTPTPETDGTPTPDEAPETQADAPQLAEDPSGQLGVAALAPDVNEQGPDVTTTDSEKIKRKERRDKSTEDGESQEQEQSAYVEPFGWSDDPVELPQTAETPPATDPAASGTGETVAPVDETGEAAAAEPVEPAPQIDPATGMEIDPATGLLIEPTTGYLLDPVNDRVIDPRTHYVVNPMTGLLIDPATGAQLDPVTLAVVIPAGFGSDQPAYDPGSPEMRGDIETVVDDTYDNASIKLEPPTDGPVQPVDDIVVPTESGEALEIS